MNQPIIYLNEVSNEEQLEQVKSCGAQLSS